MMQFVGVQNMIIQAYSKDFKTTDDLTKIANKMKNFHQLVKENPFLPDESRKIASVYGSYRGAVHYNMLRDGLTMTNLDDPTEVRKEVEKIYLRARGEYSGACRIWVS